VPISLRCNRLGAVKAQSIVTAGFVACLGPKHQAILNRDFGRPIPR